jgi:hypothetical protein
MGAKTISLSLPEWLIKDLELEGSGNRSERIQELMIKGFLAEKLKLNINEPYEVLTPKPLKLSRLYKFFQENQSINATGVLG